MDTKALLASIASHSGLLNAYSLLRRKRTKSQVAILIYHRVAPMEDNWFPPPLSPESFENQIEYFCRNYELLPLEKLAQYIQQGTPLPEKAIIITLDDGNRDNYLYAYPILQKYHAPATIFLATGHISTGKPFWWTKVDNAVQNTPLTELELNGLGRYSLQSTQDRVQAIFMIIDKLNETGEEEKNFLIEKLLSISGIDIPADLAKERILSWDEMREMKDDGISFGAHSVTHPILTHVPLEQAKFEIIQSKKDIEENLGQPVTAFAYPNGIFNTEIAEFVQESSFACAVSVSPGRLISRQDNPYRLSRIAGLENFSKSKVMLCGLWGDVQSRRGAGKNEHD